MRRKSLKREEGVAMTEFALIAPVFLLIVIGLLVFGRVFFYWIEANHTANETARWAVVDRNPYSTTLQRQAIGGATREFQSDGKVCIDFPPPTGTGAENSFASVAIGDPVRVRVHKPFTIFAGWTIMIRGSSTMRVERFGPPGSNPTAYTVAADPATGNIGNWGAVGPNDCIVPTGP